MSSGCGAAGTTSSCAADPTPPKISWSARNLESCFGENDIFFIDIGPVYGDFEGDAGDTFVFGDNPLHLKAKSDVREIWERVRAKWLSEQITGIELYEFAIKTTEEFGWKLNMDLSGHRLSDYPHSAHYDGPMAEVGFSPSPNLWVLEIAIAHPDRTFGASTRTCFSRTNRSLREPSRIRRDLNTVHNREASSSTRQKGTLKM